MRRDREDVAGMLMMGLLQGYAVNGNLPKPEAVAKDALKYADALIAELPDDDDEEPGGE